jgi:hypothetical protein
MPIFHSQPLLTPENPNLRMMSDFEGEGGHGEFYHYQGIFLSILITFMMFLLFS